MATATINYGTATAITCSTASLATSSDFRAGRESAEIDNTTNKYLDALVEGFVTTGTSPTADTEVRIYAWGSHTSLGTNSKGVLGGADSSKTVSTEGVRDSFLVRIATVQMDTSTTGFTFDFGPVSLAQAFGQMPQYWGLFVVHNTGVALHATAGNHEFKYTGIKFDSA